MKNQITCENRTSSLKLQARERYKITRFFHLLCTRMRVHLTARTRDGFHGDVNRVINRDLGDQFRAVEHIQNRSVFSNVIHRL